MPPAIVCCGVQLVCPAAVASSAPRLRLFGNRRSVCGFVSMIFPSRHLLDRLPRAMRYDNRLSIVRRVRSLNWASPHPSWLLHQSGILFPLATILNECFGFFQVGRKFIILMIRNFVVFIVFGHTIKNWYRDAVFARFFVLGKREPIFFNLFYVTDFHKNTSFKN